MGKQKVIAITAAGLALTAAATAFGGVTTARGQFKVSHCDYHTGKGCPAVPAANSCQLRGEAQDPGCTPGALNSAVTQSTIKRTICKSGWTSTIRPPTSYTNPLKLKDMKAYGFGGQSTSGFEFDHLISLELGGAPSDIRNLWPESHSNSYRKDGLENSLKHQVCDGKITLAKARREIANWPTHLQG
jgi:hypothetical protein